MIKAISIGIVLLTSTISAANYICKVDSLYYRGYNIEDDKMRTFDKNSQEYKRAIESLKSKKFTLYLGESDPSMTVYINGKVMPISNKNKFNTFSRGNEVILSYGDIPLGMIGSGIEVKISIIKGNYKKIKMNIYQDLEGDGKVWLNLVKDIDFICTEK